MQKYHLACLDAIKETVLNEKQPMSNQINFESNQRSKCGISQINYKMAEIISTFLFLGM